jgi:hypothetical protein
MLLVGLIVGLACASGAFPAPVDGLAYWRAGTSAALYPERWSEIREGLLFYPPVVAQVSALLQPIGWQVFVTALMVLCFGSFWYCAGRLSVPLLLLGVPYLLGIGPQAFSTFLGFALLGNLQWPLAAVVILSLRRPALWAVPLITKVTISIGWWWHPLRGEWRAAATGAAVALAIMGASYAADPALWGEYVGFVSRNLAAVDPPMPTFPVPLGLRLLTAAVLLVWGARTGRAWTVPVASGWSLAALYDVGFMPFWIAALRVRDHRGPSSAGAGAELEPGSQPPRCR